MAEVSTPQATPLLSFLHGNPCLLLFHMSFCCDFLFFKLVRDDNRLETNKSFDQLCNSSREPFSNFKLRALFIFVLSLSLKDMDLDLWIQNEKESEM
ncbi:hypothetical protein Hanom_Chr09g00804131 [Helianthus anomalus]